MITQLTAHRHDEAVTITVPQRSNGLPTMVLWLGPTLTVEIDPSQAAPVRIDTEDYTQDRSTIAAILGAQAAAALDDAPDKLPLEFEFVPGPDWANVRALADQQWTMEWNPLPHDRALLALDAIRAQRSTVHLTHDTPSTGLLDTAYPAARALQRLLDTDAIAPTAREVVQRSLDAYEASTPLDYTVPAEQPYTIPLPLTTEEIHAVLDPAPIDPEAILTGSPDWRLVGNGPAATAENAITVRNHATRPGALTVTVPAIAHSDPSSVPSYQALITDPQSQRVVAAATLAFTPATNAYTGHVVPHRPITHGDVVDIRITTIPHPPRESRQDRESAKKLMQAVRAYVLEHLAPRQTLTALAQDSTLLANTGTGEPAIAFVDFLTQAEYVRAAKSEHGEQAGSAQFGSIGASWTMDASGTSLRLAIDADSSEYPPLSGVRIRIAAEDTEAVYLMPFAAYDPEYVVSELTVPLPPQGFTVSIDPNRIDFSRLATAPTALLAESIQGAGPETLEAWKSIALTVPPNSAFRAHLADILDVKP